MRQPDVKEVLALHQRWEQQDADELSETSTQMENRLEACVSDLETAGIHVDRDCCRWRSYVAGARPYK